MAGIAIDRLWETLCYIDQNLDEVQPRDNAAAALDAWTIIDAAHRMSDLIENLPGLPNSTWRKIFRLRVSDCLDLRDMWQHQLGEAPSIVQTRGQTWGTIGWVKHNGDKPTGLWHYVVAGSDLKGSKYMICGPHKQIPRVESRRIRLFHQNKQVYLARVVRDMFEAFHGLEADISDGNMKVHGVPIDCARNKDTLGRNSVTVIAI